MRSVQNKPQAPMPPIIAPIGPPIIPPTDIIPTIQKSGSRITAARDDQHDRKRAIHPYSPSEPPAMVAASCFGHTADLALALGRAFGTFFGAGCFRLREVQGRAYQRKVCKALREVPKQLAGDRIDFLR